MKNFLAVRKISNIISSYNQIAPRNWARFESLRRFALFKKMSQKIPAYRKFLKESKVDINNIKSPEDILTVPPINKKNYFNTNPLKDVMWPRGLEAGLVATSTSGSTGRQSYFLRGPELDWQYSILAEYFFSNGPKGPTLLIDCFGMGVWIGGLMTYQAFYYAADRTGNITLITPGINKKEIFSALRELAPQYKNIIIAGYPPFIKDIVDECNAEKIELKKWNCRFLFAAESFTENFRDYIGKSVGIINIHKDTLNIYGSAELGAMAFETPGSIFIRRLSLQHPEIFAELFGNSNKLPTLAQYNPTLVSFEEHSGEILITADARIPFCRYQIGDSGGVYNFKDISDCFRKHGIDLVSESRKANVSILQLPFVYVYERNDFSTTLYGLQVYPQTIKRALEKSALDQDITGKFNLETYYDKKNDQYLRINIELKSGKKSNRKLIRAIEKSITTSLISENSEFRELTGMLTARRTKPKIVLWAYNDNTFFKPGVKQKWVKK